MIQLLFLLPHETRERAVMLRQDQLDHLHHLLRSWRIYGKDAPYLVHKAIKRTLNDRP